MFTFVPAPKSDEEVNCAHPNCQQAMKKRDLVVVTWIQEDQQYHASFCGNAHALDAINPNYMARA